MGRPKEKVKVPTALASTIATIGNLNPSVRQYVSTRQYPILQYNTTQFPGLKYAKTTVFYGGQNVYEYQSIQVDTGRLDPGREQVQRPRCAWQHECVFAGPLGPSREPE